MKGLQALARIGPSVFHTTWNWPLACTSPMKTGLWRGWFFASSVISKPEGDLNDWEPSAWRFAQPRRIAANPCGDRKGSGRQTGQTRNDRGPGDQFAGFPEEVRN